MISINKNCYSPQSGPHNAKLCPSVVLKHFGGNSERTFLFSHKSDYFRNEHLNTQPICLSFHVWKGANPLKNLILFKQLFLNKPVMEDKYLKKKVFLHKVIHILLKYAVLLCWSIFGAIHREHLFLYIKLTISEMSTEIIRNFVFLTMFERGKSWEKFGFL